MNALTQIPADLAALTARANEFAIAASGSGTQRAYASGFRHYRLWCEANGREPLTTDPGQIALYATAAAGMGHACSTILGRMAAIKRAHRLARVTLDMDELVFSEVLKGIANTLGTAPRRQAEPVTADMLRQMLATRARADNPIGARERAMLLIGFGAALRRSELCGLAIRDVQRMDRRGALVGISVTIRKSKTDQAAAGQRVVVVARPDEPDFCPATAFLRWMEHRRTGADCGASDQPLFCAINKASRLSCERPTDMMIVKLIKDAAGKAGFDPAIFSGHSLRAGFATSADRGGAALETITNHLRHKNPRTTMGYINFGDLSRNPSAAAFGPS